MQECNFLKFFQQITLLCSISNHLLEKHKTRESSVLLYIMNLVHTQYCFNSVYTLLSLICLSISCQSGQVSAENHKKIRSMSLIKILQVHKESVFSVNVLFLGHALAIFQMRLLDKFHTKKPATKPLKVKRKEIRLSVHSPNVLTIKKQGLEKKN